MYKKFFGSAVAAIALVSPALAAPGPPLPILGFPTGLSAGVFVPSSGAAKAGGTTQYDIEFRYGIPLPNPTPIVPVIGVAVETGSTSGSRSTIIPATAGALIGLNGISPNAGGSIFAGGGVGIYFINQHTNSTSKIGQLGTTSHAGGYVELGWNVSKLLFLDAKYQSAPRADGETATVGLRF